MAQCVVISAGAVVESTADPCTGFVLITPTEYGLLNISPLNLSAEDGLLLASAIVGVWAAAFSIRAAVRALGSDGDVHE
jgi:hypothetical protein